MLKNSLLDDAPKRNPARSDPREPQAPSLPNGKKDDDAPEAEKSISKDSSQFRFVPSINLSLEDIFAPVINSANSRNNSGGRSSSLSTPHPWMQTSVSKSSSLSSFQSLKKVGKKRRKKYSISAPYVQSDSEGEDNPRRSRLGKALVKFTMNPNDFDYFTRVVYSDEERQPDPDSGGSVTSPKNKSFPSEILPSLSLVELLQCIISIQIQLAMYEAEQKHLSSPLLATHDILQFSLDTFTSMVSELKHKRERSQDLHLLLTWMLKLVFSSIQRFIKSSEMLHNVTEFGIIPKLLKLVCTLLDFKVEADCTEMKKDSGSHQCDAGKESLALDIISGLLFLLQSCTCLKLEWKEVLECLHLHIAFLQNNGAEIIKKIVLHSKALSLNRQVEILDSISHLVMYLKYWREDIYHSEKCDKKSHRFCEYQTVQNHHSQVFGINAGNIKTIHPGRCMISNFCDILLDCFAGSKDSDLSAFAIKALSRCGLCCCMSSKSVLSKLLEGLPEQIAHVVNYVAFFIENIVWRDLSGMVVAEPVKCSFCQKLRSETGSNLMSNDYTSDESFMSNFITKGKSPYHQFQAGEGEGAERSTHTVVFWEGLGIYTRLLSGGEITSKVINHIVRLVCQSNTDVKLAMCEHLVIPVIKKICNDSVADYISRQGNEKEILASLIKCLRLTLMESDDLKLMEFLHIYGPGLIADCKEIQGLRHETFLLLCNTVKKELKLKPSFLVMGEIDEEHEMVFAKLFEWEVIEHDEFWSAYFGMKAEEVRQKFFIRTRQSMDRSEDRRGAVARDENTPTRDSDEVDSSVLVGACGNVRREPREDLRRIQESSMLTDSIELGTSVIGHLEEAEKDSLQRQIERRIENAGGEQSARGCSSARLSDRYEDSNHFLEMAASHNEDTQAAESYGADRNAESLSNEPEAEQWVGSEVLGNESGQLESEESVTLQGPANESSSASESFLSDQLNEAAGYSGASRYSTPIRRCEGAEGGERLNHQTRMFTKPHTAASEHPEEGWKVCIKELGLH